MFNKKIISDIKAKFQLTFHSCKPTVNEKFDSGTNRTNIEIACLITNYKSVYFTSRPEILNKLDPLLKIHLSKIKKINYLQYFLSKPAQINQQIIMIPHYSQENRIILYNNDGTRQAFLLFIRDTEQNINEFLNPGSWAESENHYLTGLLLCYQKKDILFFYKIAAFKEYLLDTDEITPLKITEKNIFVTWPEKEKNQFYDFLKISWLHSDTYSLYKRDKKEAQDWIEKYYQLSLEKIQLIILELNNKLSSLATDFKNKQ